MCGQALDDTTDSSEQWQQSERQFREQLATHGKELALSQATVQRLEQQLTQSETGAEVRLPVVDCC